VPETCFTSAINNSVACSCFLLYTYNIIRVSNSVLSTTINQYLSKNYSILPTKENYEFQSVSRSRHVHSWPFKFTEEEIFFVHKV